MTELPTLLRSIHKAKSIEHLSDVARAIDAARLSAEHRRVAEITLADRREYIRKLAVTL